MDGGERRLEQQQLPEGRPQNRAVSLDDVGLCSTSSATRYALLQDVTYPTLAGTPRGFVELPSQINEQWVFTRELPDRFAALPNREPLRPS